MLQAGCIARARPVPDPRKRTPLRGWTREPPAHSAGRPSTTGREPSFGNRRISEAAARREAEKLAVPEVRIPRLLYRNRITSSHSFARGLSGFAVIATRF